MKEAVHTLTNDGGTGIPLGTEKQRPRRVINQMLQERTSLGGCTPKRQPSHKANEKGDGREAKGFWNIKRNVP
jgi:hypothetical protein